MRHLLTVVLVVGMLAGCGSDGATPDETVGASSPSSATPSPGPSPPDPGDPASSAEPEAEATMAAADSLAVLEGRWMCDVQRFTFADLDALDQELTARLDAGGFTREDYESFRIDLQSSADARAQVLGIYQDYCDDAETAAS